MSENVVILNFAEPSKAYQALSELKGGAENKHVGVKYAAVAERHEDGEFALTDGTNDPANDAKPLTGTLIGSLIGMLAGPVGVALGAASGAILGKALRENKIYDRLDVLDEVGMTVPKGATSLIAVLEEDTPWWVDDLAARLGAGVARRPLDHVQAAVAARGTAQFQDAKEALRNNEPVK